MATERTESGFINSRSRTRNRIRTRSFARMGSVVRRMRIVDAALVFVSLIAGEIVRFGFGGLVSLFRSHPVHGAQAFYALLPFALTLAWSLTLQLNGAYDHRRLGGGAQAYTSIMRSTVICFTLLALTSYIFDLQISRGFVLVAFPLAALLLTLACWRWRVWLLRRRLEGAFLQRALVVGNPESLTHLIPALTRDSGCGYQVVAACSNTPHPTLSGVPVVAPENRTTEVALGLEVDTIICASGDLGPHGVRSLGWALERSGIDLVVVASLQEVNSQRVTDRAVNGLHLLLVKSPHFTDAQAMLKSMIDRILGAVLLVLLSPVMAVAALLVKREDHGPVLLHQTRVGLDGHEFAMLKFRSMVPNAAGMRAELLDEVEDAVDRGPMFKRRNDPRITRIGRILRRTSIDELPQLLNVVRGDMSLVGPRPPLPHEVTTYTPTAKRRLLVRPGMTGLWQINGRSDLSWDDTIRLDLYYVENWSVTFDLLILFRTAKAVLQQKGAY